MSCKISKNNIILTRGDTLRVTINITDSNGEIYVPQEGDSIRFAMKSDYLDKQPLVVKDVSIDTLELKLDPEDTKSLDFGVYVYDIEITKSNGDVDTFIDKATIRLKEEVY